MTSWKHRKTSRRNRQGKKWRKQTERRIDGSPVEVQTKMNPLSLILKGLLGEWRSARTKAVLVLVVGITRWTKELTCLVEIFNMEKSLAYSRSWHASHTVVLTPENVRITSREWEQSQEGQSKIKSFRIGRLRKLAARSDEGPSSHVFRPFSGLTKRPFDMRFLLCEKNKSWLI